MNSTSVETPGGKGLFSNATLSFLFQAYNVEETIAISSQVMNSNNFRVVLEEVLKADNLPRHLLPPDVDSRSPAEQARN